MLPLPVCESILEKQPHSPAGSSLGSPIKEKLGMSVVEGRARQPEEEDQSGSDQTCSRSPSLPGWGSPCSQLTSSAGAFLYFFSRLPAYHFLVPMCHSHHPFGINAIFYAYFSRRLDTQLSVHMARAGEKAAMEKIFV